MSDIHLTIPRSELYKLPKDVLVHLIPYLSCSSSVEVWAERVKTWVSTRDVNSIGLLSEYVDVPFTHSMKDTRLFSDCCDSGAGAYLVFSENEDIMPYSVYRELTFPINMSPLLRVDVRSYQFCNDIWMYMRLLEARRAVQAERIRQRQKET
jgi:hypothetical protein